MIRFISELTHEEYFKKFDIKFCGYGYSYMDGFCRTNVIDKEYMINVLYLCRPIGMTKKMIKNELIKIKKYTK